MKNKREFENIPAKVNINVDYEVVLSPETVASIVADLCTDNDGLRDGDVINVIHALTDIIPLHAREMFSYEYFEGLPDKEAKYILDTYKDNYKE